MVAFNRNLQFQGQQAFFCGIQNVASEKYEVICVLDFRLRFQLVCRSIVVGHALVDGMTDFEDILALLVNDHWEIVVGGDELFSCFEVVESKISDAELERELSGSLAWSVII